ncbi:MAG: DUF58 domain-containing protein [Eubacteriales bacterium]|nr:DUF58 domain-containing protein [Eubacteriales bacterium]
MSEIFDSSFLNKLQNIAISSRISVSGGLGGNRKSRSKGSSVEFSDYREYATGDDFRRIDWNAYGKFEKLFLKLFMEEREAPINIMLDTSASMNFGEPGKSVASRRLAAALSFIALANYDRLGLYGLTDKATPQGEILRGRYTFPKILNFLENISYEGTTDLLNAIKGCKISSDRGVTILISDMFSQGESTSTSSTLAAATSTTTSRTTTAPAATSKAAASKAAASSTSPTLASLEEVIKYLRYRKQDVYLCHVLSPQEIDPELDSDMRLIDSETGDFRDIAVSSFVAEAYRKVFKEYIHELEAICMANGAWYMLLPTTIPIEEMIRKVVEV